MIINAKQQSKPQTQPQAQAKPKRKVVVVKKYNPVKHMLKITYWVLLAGIVALLLMLGFEMFTLGYEGTH